MKCISEVTEVKLNNAAVTVGKFDGLHKGHGKLIDVLKENAGERASVVLTFAAKPIDIINCSKSLTIVTEQEKKLLCEAKEIDYYVSLPLTQEFLDLSPEAFIKDILVDKLDMSLIVCGPDFKFGRFGAGNIELLKKMSKYYGYKVVVVEKEQYHNRDIGSTEIREKILAGEIAEANEMLGHPFNIIGRVEEGKKLGTKMGLPTANIIPEATKILPPKGVYKTKTIIDGKSFNSISNIGVNPTVEDTETVKVETHIIDYKEEIYGEIIEIQFFEFLRPEMKFENIEALKTQIKKDINKALQNT